MFIEKFAFEFKKDSVKQRMFHRLALCVSGPFMAFTCVFLLLKCGGVLSDVHCVCKNPLLSSLHMLYSFPSQWCSSHVVLPTAELLYK